MNRVLSLAIACLIAASVFLPAAAVADDGLSIFVFVGPEDQGVGDTLDIRIEAYMWGQPVQLDNLEATIGISGTTTLTLQQHGNGKYQASYVINSTDVSFGLLLIAVQGDEGGLFASGANYYFTSDAGGGSSGWELTMRMVDYGQFPMGLLPGATVVIEARSYNNGTLAEGAAMNSTLAFSSLMGAPGSPSPLNGTKVSDGVYRFTVQVPASLSATTSYTVGVQAGPLMARIGDTMTFIVQPFGFITSVKNVTATSAVVNVVTGIDAPISGAAITITGTIIMSVPPYFAIVGPFNASTDARGHASIPITWTGGAPTSLIMNLSAQGKAAITSIMLPSAGGPGTWQPDPNTPVGCSATLQTDPSTIAAGTTATLKFRVTEDGAPVANSEVAVFLRSNTAMAMESAGNETTDAAGNLTVIYAVAANWNFFEDMLLVDVVCPAADSVSISETLGAPGGSFMTDHLAVTVTGNAERGGSVQVTATYNGTASLAGAYAIAILYPGENPQDAVASLGGFALATALVAGTGTSFVGTVNIPEHWDEGNYTLIVLLSNYGATADRSNEVQEGGFQKVQVAAPGAGPGPTPSSGGFLPGFEAAAVVAALGALVVVGRRRR